MWWAYVYRDAELLIHAAAAAAELLLCTERSLQCPTRYSRIRHKAGIRP